MNPTAEVVIGSNFGDEGKGLVTDFLVDRAGSGTVVVRFNGGAQASHTVVAPDGRRHAFSHFSAGTFGNAITYLSRFFLVNPILFWKEWNELGNILMKEPIIAMNRQAIVTTPYDILLNQMAEKARGSFRHGSCGVGINETVERSQYRRYCLTVENLRDRDVVVKKLRDIAATYVPARAANIDGLDVRGILPDHDGFLRSDAVVDNFLYDCTAMLRNVEVADHDFLQAQRHVIFEGAQGLGLDELYGKMPHVTRSRTGIHNVLRVAVEAGLQGLDVTYVTRAYLTRHGAGPLPHEDPDLAFVTVDDPTNIPNAFQGSLRLSYLDVDALGAAVWADAQEARSSGLPARHGVAVTCLDQLKAHVLWAGGEQRVLSEPRFLAEIARATDAPITLVSHGPSRRDVTEKVATTA